MRKNTSNTALIVKGLSRKSYDVIRSVRKNHSILIISEGIIDRLLITLIFKSKVIMVEQCHSTDHLFLPLEISHYAFALEHQLNCVMSDLSVVQNLANKEKFQSLLEEMALPIPKRHFAFEEIKVDLIAKPINGSGSRGIIRSKYPHDILKGIENDDFVFQELLPNGSEIFGYFAYCIEGNIKYWYTHERLSTYPREGGVSVMACSGQNFQLHELSLRVIERLSYSGFIMFEFLKNPQGDYVFIECNPRLWGSYMLSNCLSDKNESIKGMVNLALSGVDQVRYTPHLLYWPLPYGIPDLWTFVFRAKKQNYSTVNLDYGNFFFVFVLYVKNYVKNRF